MERGVLYRDGTMEGCTERLVAEASADSNFSGRPVGGLRENASVEGIQRWMSCTRRSSFSRCLSSARCLSFSFSSELELDRIILVGVGVDIDIRRGLGGIVAGRAMSAPLTRGVPDRTEGVIDRWAETCIEVVRECIGNAGRARGDWKDGVYDVRVGDVGEVAPERDPDIVDGGRGGEIMPEGTELGGGVAGTPKLGAADLTFERLSSARRV